VLEPGLVAGKPVLIGATAGTARHSLVLEHALRPLFAHLKALPVPTAVFAASEDFGSTSAGALAERVERAGAELARLVAGSPVTSAPRNGFEDPTPFEELLRG
jgi:FMN reductase